MKVLLSRFKAACLLPLVFVMSVAQADGAYPTKPVRLVAPIAPGGMTDIVARLVANKLAARLGQSVVVENRVGAGGGVGAEAVARAAPDGYTLLMAFPAPLVVSPYVLTKIGYDAEKDFTPVNLLASYPMALAVHPAVPAANVAELVEHAKQAASPLMYGSAGIGSTAHLAMELFARRGGMRMVHVPYRGAAPAMNDLLGGALQLTVDSLTLIMPHHDSGRIRALAVTSKDRSPAFPNLPTIAESGVAALKDFEVIGWYGILAPTGTPAAIVSRLSRELTAIIKDPDVRKELESRGMVALGDSPAKFQSLIDQERTVWRRLITEAKIKVE